MKATDKPLATAPSPSSPTFGLLTTPKGNLILDVAAAKAIDFETSLAIVLFAKAGWRFVDNRDSYTYLLNRVARFIDDVNGGLRPEFQQTYVSPMVIVAADAHRARVNERKVMSSCMPIFVGGLPPDCTERQVGALFTRWDVKHIYLGAPKAGQSLAWAKVYMLPEGANAALEYYSLHEALIEGQPVNIAKATRTENIQPNGARKE
jgi:hypothetical protein